MRILRNKRQSGFTLIELLVVIAIIGLLASVVLLSLNSARQKSRDAKRLADIRQIASALEVYFNDCGSYPVEAATAPVPLDSTNKLFNGTGTNCGNNDGSGGANGGIGPTASGTTTYLGQFPNSPLPADTTTCSDATWTAGGTNPAAYAAISNVPNYNGAAGNWNSYYYYGTATNYQVTFCLGAATGGYAAGKHILTASGIQ